MKWRLSLKVNNRVSSKITVQVLCGDEIKRSYEFSNIFTNFGLQNWARASLGTRLAVGSGSQTEDESITTLASYERSQTGTYSYTETNYIDTVADVMRSDHILFVEFSAETSNRNYSEMGIHSGDFNQLQTYALIRDELGQPTSVTLLTGEKLRVYYVVQFSVPLLTNYTKKISNIDTQVSIVPMYTGGSNTIRLPHTDRVRVWEGGQPVPDAGVVLSNYNTTSTSVTHSDNICTAVVNAPVGNYTSGLSMFKVGDTVSRVSLYVHVDPPVYKTDIDALKLSIQCTLSNGSYHA